MILCRVALLALTCVSLAFAQDWPQFRGPERDGIARGAKPPVEWSATKNLEFKVELPGPGSSSPIVVGDRVFVTCYTGYGSYLADEGEPSKLRHHLLAFDRHTGKLLFERVIAGHLTGPARKVQIIEHGFASPTPASDGEALYLYLGRAGMVAYDLSGTLLWMADLGEPSKDAPPATNSVERGGKRIPLRWGAASSPLLFEDLVIVNASEESNALQAFNKKTGERVWRRESSDLEGCSTSPLIVGPKDDPAVIFVLGGAIWGLHPRTGALLFNVETGTRGGICPSPVADDGRIYLLGGSGDGCAIALAGVRGSATEPPKSLWEGASMDVPSPIVHKGVLYVLDQRGMVARTDVTSGETRPPSRLQGRTGGIYASPVLADDKLYVVSRKNGVFVYDLNDEMKLLATNVVDDESQFNASLAPVGTKLYLRSDRALYCFSTKAQ